MSKEVDKAIDALMESEALKALTNEQKNELALRVMRGELSHERCLSTITVKIETLDGEPTADLIDQLASRFGTIIEQEWMAGGEDLMGYDGTLVVRYDIETEAAL